MDVRSALRAAADENHWTPTQVAAVAGISENAMRRFYAGEIATLKSTAVLALMRDLPGFAIRLGYAPHGGPRSVAV